MPSNIAQNLTPVVQAKISMGKTNKQKKKPSTNTKWPNFLCGNTLKMAGEQTAPSLNTNNMVPICLGTTGSFELLGSWVNRELGPPRGAALRKLKQFQWIYIAVILEKLESFKTSNLYATCLQAGNSLFFFFLLGRDSNACLQCSTESLLVL